MATLITISADFRLSTGASASVATAGETIVPFQLLYLKTSDSKAYLADNATAAEAVLLGFAATGAAVDEFVSYVPATSGAFIESASALFTKGDCYEISSTAGSMATAGDATAGQFVTVVGVAISTTKLQIINASTGVSI